MITVKLIKMPECLKDDDWIDVGFILYGASKPGYFRLYEPDDIDIPNEYVERISGDPLIGLDGKELEAE